MESQPPSGNEPGGMSRVLSRNIEAIQQHQAAEAGSVTMEERLALAVTAFAGSIRFVYLHMALYGGWILVNVGLVPGLPRFDPSLVILAMTASVEAIFLSTFILIKQNRMAAEADHRADLDLQINLLTEHELTRLMQMVAAIADKVDARAVDDEEIGDMTRDIKPEAVLDEIEREKGARE